MIDQLPRFCIERVHCVLIEARVVAVGVGVRPPERRVTGDIVYAVEPGHLRDVLSAFQIELQFLVTREVASLLEQERPDDRREVDAVVVVGVRVLFVVKIEVGGEHEAVKVLQRPTV